MKRGQYTKSLRDLVGSLSLFDTIALSGLLVPLYLAAVLTIVNYFAELDIVGRTWFLLLVGSAIVSSIIITRLSVGLRDERGIARLRIRDYLLGWGARAVSFQRIASVIDPSYTPEFLLSVIDAFPEELRLARMKGGGRGIGLVLEEEEPRRF